MVKTNTSSNDVVNSNMQSNADIGESSQNINGKEESTSESYAIHEISAVKSIASNDNIIPYVLLAIVMFLAFVVGYKKQQEY
jgi:hypothetical protein